jgi:hypothetical protein
MYKLSEDVYRSVLFNEFMKKKRPFEHSTLLKQKSDMYIYVNYKSTKEKLVLKKISAISLLEFFVQSNKLLLF